LAAFFTDVLAGVLLPCFCFLTVFLAGDVLATAFLPVFLAADFFAFFDLLVVALTAGFFSLFAFFAFVVFLVFAGIGPPPQFDDRLSEELTIEERISH
jgi:hypothetical protein